MANQEQLEILRQGVEVWNQWREDIWEEDYSDIWIDLTEADLAGTDLKVANLSGAELGGASLRKANLAGANLAGANLSGADLTEANLAGASLWNANLSGAELVGAGLRKADLRGADLTGAYLTRADLVEADLRKADLSSTMLWNANLSKAELWETFLTRAVLERTNFKESEVAFTIFTNTDLSTAIGLETIVHAGPSTISTDTIRKSKGKIPIEFLRGCGLSDIEIEYAKLATPGLDPEQVTQITNEIYRLYCNQPIQFYDCFISYNNKDQDFTRRLHDDLQNNGVRCWFAPEDMKIGDEFRNAIGSQIRLRDKLLVILSENSIHSEWVGDEVEKALTEEKEQGKLKLFPIRIDDAVFKSKDDWAEKIRLRRHIGDFSNDYDSAFQKLLRDLKSQS